LAEQAVGRRAVRLRQAAAAKAALPRSALPAAASTATTPASAALVAEGRAAAVLRARRLDGALLGDLGHDHGLVGLQLPPVDHPIMVGVEGLEEAGGVGDELLARQLAVAVGVGAPEPDGDRI